jgi:hypothetical protein
MINEFLFAPPNCDDRCAKVVRMGNVMNQVNAFGLQPFVNLTLQGLQVGSLEYLHFHSARFSGDPAVVKRELPLPSERIVP